MKVLLNNKNPDPIKSATHFATTCKSSLWGPSRLNSLSYAADPKQARGAKRVACLMTGARSQINAKGSGHWLNKHSEIDT